MLPRWEHAIKRAMQVLSKRTLKLFWDAEPAAEPVLRAWFSTVSHAVWETPQDVKAMFGSADFVADSRVIFDIGGNKYRVVAHIAYPFGRVLIKFVGTHKEYDKIAAATIGKP